MKILLHICCGPCSIFPVDELRADGHELHGFFYNPNIHPFTEHEKRLETLEKYAEEINLPLIEGPRYELEKYLREVVFRESERCLLCYRMRLTQTAKFARKGKFDAISSTLLYSRFQKHDLIREMGLEAAKEEGLKFLYMDFREGWKEGVVRSKEMGMYRQQYCGCIYSEKERYFK